MDRVSPLLESLPFDRNEATGRFAIDADDFELRRIDALAGEFNRPLAAPSDADLLPFPPASFRQVAKLLAPRDITAASTSVSKASLLNLLRGMLTAMKDNLAVSDLLQSVSSSSKLTLLINAQAILDEPTRRGYATFCRAVLEALRKSGSAELNDQSLPDMRVLATATAVQI